MKTSLKDKMYGFLFGAEGINKGDCITYSYESVLWGLLLWFASFDKMGVPIFVFFIVWAVLMVWMWGAYFKAKKAEEAEDAELAAKKENANGISHT